MKTFEDWYNASEWREGDNAVLVADDAWEYQAERIKHLEHKLREIRGLVRPIIQNAPMILEAATPENKQ